jgi:hypothetical protein
MVEAAQEIVAAERAFRRASRKGKRPPAAVQRAARPQADAEQEGQR